MQAVFYQRCNFLSSFLLLVIALLFSACDYYNFESPQPADSENIYEFPDAFLGEWDEQDTNSAGFDNSIPIGGASAQSPQTAYVTRPGYDDSTYLLIAKKYVRMIFISRERVVKGAWPRVDREGNFIYPEDYFIKNKIQKEISYDSLKNPTDTTDNYLLSGNRIYELAHNEYLEKGYSYYEDHDTIVILKNDTLFIDLGQNAFLRQLGNESYVFNFRNHLVTEKATQWWSIRILEKTGTGSFLMRTCNSKTGNLPSMFHEAISKADIFYFNSRWTAAELLELLKEGYFDTESTYYKRK